jgi:hypothetical protein
MLRKHSALAALPCTFSEQNFSTGHVTLSKNNLTLIRSESNVMLLLLLVLAAMKIQFISLFIYVLSSTVSGKL